ncbi:hypothetical protein [Legionella yabuuchiae]|uniref:hypothetical protein n=1 Tax=Legionella yabuuchiae TaxID=376727 RepID=UPI001055E8E0|nr:hypothetical protein [Legionella yabuuchiae]
MFKTKDLNKLNDFFDKTPILVDGYQAEMVEQTGNNCKLIAIYNALQVLLKQKYPHLSDRKIQALHARRLYTLDKMTMLDHKTDMSQLAIANRQGSLIGELYGIEAIEGILKANMLNPNCLSFDSKAAYAEGLKSQLKDHNLPAIVFFDAGFDKFSSPAFYKGKREHGAVALGYGEKDGKTCIVLFHRNQYIVVSFDLLVDSTFQLQEHCPERFYRFWQFKQKEPQNIQMLKLYKDLHAEVPPLIEKKQKSLIRLQARYIVNKSLINALEILGETPSPYYEKLSTNQSKTEKKINKTRLWLDTWIPANSAAPRAFDDSYVLSGLVSINPKKHTPLRATFFAPKNPKAIATKSSSDPALSSQPPTQRTF